MLPLLQRGLNLSNHLVSAPEIGYRRCSAAVERLPGSRDKWINALTRPPTRVEWELADMYGMIHQALRSMALQHIGETGWQSLLQDAGLTQPLFIGMEYYSDDTTMTLVRMVAQRLNMRFDDALREFGEVWIDFAEASDYGRILRMAGLDFEYFLDSLDRMHASIRSNMPKAEMPSFELLSAEASELQLRYRSKRKGLAPFVHGILLAVAKRCGEHVTITFNLEDEGALFIIKRVQRHA